MEKIVDILKHPDELYPLVKLKMAAAGAASRIPAAPPHWRFCYAMLHRLSSSFPLLIHHLPSHLRDPVCVFYLVLRALDTVEDDTSIPADIKVPILLAFHEHIHESGWHFSCGTKDYKVLMDEFHHVSTAFSKLQRGYQEAIEEITRLMGAGMAKFISKEVESIEDFHEYSGYVGGLVGLGLSRIFRVSNMENSAREDLSNSMGSFLSKTNIIQDFLEDINEMPKSRMFWPREIWSKYVDKLSDLKYEENSKKAVKCLNDIVTVALMHVEDCLNYLSSLQDQESTFKCCAIPQVMAIGTLTLCYNNDQFFKGVVKMRRGLAARIFDGTNTMADVYGAFYDFSCMLKAKIDENDPDATKTITRIERIQKICRESGTLDKRKLHIVRNSTQNDQILKLVLMIMVAALVLRLSVVKFGRESLV